VLAVNDQAVTTARAAADEASLVWTKEDAESFDQPEQPCLVAHNTSLSESSLRLVLPRNTASIQSKPPVTFPTVAFAETLADLRRSRDLTQVALAQRAGVNVSQLRKYEAGGSEPSLSALRRLAVALSCTTDALAFGDDPRLPDDEALRLTFEATTFLDDAERATVREVLDAFIARHSARHAEDRPRRPRARRPVN
jgi:transcriptional regulator with XRE-family HTH domain